MLRLEGILQYIKEGYDADTMGPCVKIKYSSLCFKTPKNVRTPNLDKGVRSLDSRDRRRGEIQIFSFCSYMTFPSSASFSSAISLLTLWTICRLASALSRPLTMLLLRCISVCS